MGSLKGEFKGYVLIRPTPDEMALLDGRKGLEYSSFFRDVKNSGVINPNHYAFWRKTTDDFSNAIKSRKQYATDDPVFEGGVLKSNSVYHARLVGLAKEDFNERQYLAMNFHNVNVDANGFFSAILSCPIKWNLAHIQQRIKERHGTPLEENTNVFAHHNAMALSMLRIFDDINDESPITYRPFVLPHREGLLLGHTILPEVDARNRLALMVSAENRQLNLQTYRWLPEKLMVVNSYIGQQEMTPAQKDLHKKLIPFKGGDKAKGFWLELDTIDQVRHSPSFDKHPEARNYAVTYLALEEIMHSDAWSNTVKMPENFVPPHLKRNWGPS